MYKVIVAGSRDFYNYELLEYVLIKFLKSYKPSQVQIVSGGAYGADSLGEIFATEKNCNLKVFPANWRKYRKGAGYRRNLEMGHYADACVCFWDGKSKGTKHMIDIAKERGLRLLVIEYNKCYCRIKTNTPDDVKSKCLVHKCLTWRMNNQSEGVSNEPI